jgi:hypothetical protein
MNNFNLKKFLVENKLTSNSRMLNEYRDYRDANIFANTGDGFEEKETDIKQYIDAASKAYFEDLGNPEAVVVTVGCEWSAEDNFPYPVAFVKNSKIEKLIGYESKGEDDYVEWYSNLLHPGNFEDLESDEQLSYFEKEMGNDTDADSVAMDYSELYWYAYDDSFEQATRQVLDKVDALNLGISREELESAFMHSKENLY